MSGLRFSSCEEGLIRSAAAQSDARSHPMILAATVLASSMAFIDGSVVNVALPAIQAGLRADGTAAPWIMNAYLLLLGALVLVGGAAADRFGRRLVLLIGIGVFTVASIACGAAPSVPMLIAARAAQGVGAALLTPASLAILGASFSESERGRAIGVWAAAGSVTAAAGPLLGGWLVDSLSWRAIFLLNVPVAIAAAVLALKFIPESRDPAAKGLDGPGAVLAALGLGLSTWALTEAASRGFAWLPLQIALGAGVLALIAFVVWETRTAAPMIPLAMFASRDFLAANLLTLFLYFALGGALFFLPFELIRLEGYSATRAGAVFLPFSLVMSLFSSAAGRLAYRIGPRMLLTAGPLVAAAGFLLFARAVGGGYWTGVLPATVVLAVGMVLSVAPLTAAVMGSAGTEHAGAASGINNAVARVAGLLAVAVMSLVFAARFDAALGRLGAPATGRPARGQALATPLAAGEGPLARAEREAFADAYRLAMLVAAGAAGGAGVAGWFVRGVRPTPRRS